MKHVLAARRFVVAGLFACAVVRAVGAPPAATGPSVQDRVSHSEMPDALVAGDGRRITNGGEWRPRREEMKRVLEEYLLGHAPPPPGNVVGREVESRVVMEGGAKFRLVHLAFGPERKLGLDAAVFTPGKGEGPFPTIVHVSFYPTPGTVPAAPDAGTRATTRALEAQRNAARMADPEEAAKLYADALGRGYAVMAFNYQQCGADRKAGYRETGFFPAYPEYDWGDLAAWAWGMSRCVDYLETQPFADKAKLIALGHSRLGKATLVAGAFDERFAMVAPAGSGCAGTGAFRFNGKGRGGKEGLEDVCRNFPQWVSPNLGQFGGRVEKLPFDQHWLIALTAPRAFIAADSWDDPHCNGNALKESYLAAKPVYELLGVPGRLGVHFRAGPHALAGEDWTAILDFADREVMGKRAERRFDELPEAGRLR
jgi:hypothetical protein